MEYFLQYNRDAYGLSEKAISLLEENLEVVKVGKGQILLHQGETNNYLYFVSTGLVRCWFAKETKEYTLNFALEGELAIFPLEGHKHSPLTVVAIEESILFRISQNRLDELFLESPELAIWGYKTIKAVMSLQLNDYINFFWMSKKDGYMRFLEKHPDILQRIPQKDIASYFNITASSLSRIRAEVKL